VVDGLAPISMLVEQRGGAILLRQKAMTENKGLVRGNPRQTRRRL
jgi:hypothetical protein